MGGSSSSKQHTMNLKKHAIGTWKTWKFGLISRDVYRLSENRFELNDSSDGWSYAIVTYKTMEALLFEKKDILSLNWRKD